MTGRLLRSTTAVLLLTFVASAPVGAATAKEIFAAATAREEAVRSALTRPIPPATTLAEGRAAIAAYLSLVRQFPRSGYSDDALWQAAELSLACFSTFGEARDRVEGLKLLNRLAAEYPTSKFTRRVPERLSTVEPERAEHAHVDGSAPSLAPAAGHATHPTPTAPIAVATITRVRRSVLPEVVRVTIELDREVTFHDERIDGPARVFLDLPGATTSSALRDKTLRFDSDSDLVRQIRMGRQSGHAARIVLDATGMASYSVYALYNPFRLVVDCVRPAPLPSLSAATPAEVAENGPGTSNGAAPAQPTPPPGGFTMARQLGLGVTRIVIDPGHGGHDPGASGKGITEAELVLDVALRVEKLLRKVRGAEVILTRRTDEFIPLPERTAIANREGADLFLSIHANASPTPDAKGIETYFLNFADNQSAAAVAARENAASGQGMAALPDLLKAIALNNKLDESRDFAGEVQKAMAERLRAANRTLKDLGVKQAPFVVLIGAAMPSVLAEISFVTNPQEARLLRSPVYRQRIAEALFTAIRRYQTSLSAATTVAHK